MYYINTYDIASHIIYYIRSHFGSSRPSGLSTQHCQWQHTLYAQPHSPRSKRNSVQVLYSRSSRNARPPARLVGFSISTTFAVMRDDAGKL